MPERMEKGFYPAMPCQLYVKASTLGLGDVKLQRWCFTDIVEKEPYSEFRDHLVQHLAAACTKLDLYTREYVMEHGEPWPNVHAS